MKMQRCQAKNKATSWDDLIDFTEAKIKEMQEALKTFKRKRDAGEPWSERSKVGRIAVS